MSILLRARRSLIVAANALGIGAASFAERNGKWDSGTGIWDWGTGIWERGGNVASKDIAESPTRSGTPNIMSTDNGQQSTDSESLMN